MRLTQEQVEIALFYRDRGIKLKPAEVRTLAALSGRRIVSLDHLVEALWGDDPGGGPLCAEEVLRTYVCKLRKQGFRIRTVYGQGYVFVADPFGAWPGQAVASSVA